MPLSPSETASETPSKTTSDTKLTHRFALSISGGIALGSYEAGVLSQMYRDLVHFNAHPDIVDCASLKIDVIAGASAGSITGLLLAQALSLGLTPDVFESRMRAFWVELLDIRELLEEDPHKAYVNTLFTDAVIDKIASATLELEPQPRPEHGVETIALWITMTNLDGLPYIIDFGRKGHVQASVSLYALNHRDYQPYLIRGGDIRRASSVEKLKSKPEGGANADTDFWSAAQPATWEDAKNAATASSAFPFALPSQQQERDLTQYPEYMRFKREVESGEQAAKSHEPGVTAGQPVPKAKGGSPAPNTRNAEVKLPTRAEFEFIDGGLFNNEPIGKAIDAAAFLDRLNTARASDHNTPVERSFLIIEPEPQVPADVAAAMQDVASAKRGPSAPPAALAKIIGAYFYTALYSDFAAAANVNRRLAQMQTALDKLKSAVPDKDTFDALSADILKAAGLEHKQSVTLERIPHTSAASRKLASAFSGHFGGFLRQDYREADFITGRWEARQWLVEWLTLWLQKHTNERDITLPHAINADYIQSLLGGKVPDPAETHIFPTDLLPQQLGASGWQPREDAPGHVSDTARLAALSDEERTALLEQFEKRMRVLLDAWLHLKAPAAAAAHFAEAAAALLLNHRLAQEHPVPYKPRP